MDTDKPEDQLPPKPPGAVAAGQRARQAAAELLPEGIPPGTETRNVTPPPVPAEAWRGPVNWIYGLAPSVAPNWTWEGEHRALIVDGAAEVLEQFFPGGLENIDQWGPWAKLAAGLTLLTIANFDWEARKVKPMRKKQTEESHDEGTERRASDLHRRREPQRKNGADHTGNRRRKTSFDMGP